MKMLVLYGCILISISLANDIDPAIDGLPEITEHPLDVIVGKGEPATLNCAAKGASEYLWYKDGQPVITAREETTSHRLILNNGALFLLRVHSGKSGKESDSGTYYCVARNKYGEVRSREAELKIAMLRDDFRTRPRNVQAVIGGRAVLECSPPKGFPEPVVTWKKDDRELSIHDDTRITLHPSGNLVIESVRRSDSGFYQCIASNMVGEKSSNPARVSVYEKPHFQQRPDDVTSEVGSSVLFACRVSGDPMPVIVWRKKDAKMPLGRAQILDNKGLRIDRVIASDEGEYICQAKNAAGAIDTSARLTVHAPPKFNELPVDQTVDQGSTASFICEADGNPPPARFWSKEGQQELMFPGHVSPDRRIKVSGDGELLIAGVGIADQGYYVCSALNAAGSNIAKAYLKVSGRTVLTNPPPLIEFGHSNQTLTPRSNALLPCKAIGRIPPTISWMRNGKTVEDNRRYSQLATGSLQINNLKKSDSGVYTCKAKNADGEATWTASLLVEEHTNPDVIFSRMPDAATFPSAPGTPTAVNITESGVLLRWSVPAESGTVPIDGYILQYFSPEKGQTWYNVGDYARQTEFFVGDLPSGLTFIFVVRAENRNGIGKPSSHSNPIVTKGRKNNGMHLSASADLDLDLARKRLGEEQLIKLLEVKTVNSTAMKLFWRPKRHESLIQGYYIKWRGPERNWINVTSASVSSHTVTQLKPYTTYAFFVIPYHKSVQGLPSNSLEGTTDEAPPSSVPSDIRVRMMNLTTLRISWRPPVPAGINGLLKGYQIVVIGNNSQFNRNISTNERAASVTLFHLMPAMSYLLKVAAKNGAGIGAYYTSQPVTMDKRTLDYHLLLSADGSGRQQLLRIVKTPVFIGSVGVLLWAALMVLIVVVYWRRRKAKGKAAARLGMPFIKINDGSVHMTARDALWMDHANYNSAQRSLLLNNSLSNQRPAVYQHDGREYYLLDSAPPDYPGFVPTSTMSNDEGISDVRILNRASSPHHYHYAVLGNGQQTMSSFYPLQDDPSPYATTTLVMDAQRQRWLHDHMLRGPPIPPQSGPPPPPGGFPVKTSSTQSESPPNTDVSYVHSDGTGGSSNGNVGSHQLLAAAYSRRTPKPTLMDFIPPPPPGMPPPPTTSAPLRRRDPIVGVPIEEPMLRYLSSSPLQTTDRGIRNGNVARSKLDRTNGYCDQIEGSQTDGDEVSSESDGERFEADLRHKNGGSEFVPSRPNQPTMGISASALSQSSCYEGLRSGSTSHGLKSLPRNGHRDFV